MATIGPNSPAVPIERAWVPKGVSKRPASRHIGNMVPSAVVVRCEVRSQDRSAPVLGSEADNRPQVQGRAICPNQVADSLSGRPLMRSKSIS